MNPELDKIYEIVDEGMMPSVEEQLVNCFGSSGKTPIYFKPTNNEVIMLASTKPITAELYAEWLREDDGE